MPAKTDIGRESHPTGIAGVRDSGGITIGMVCGMAAAVPPYIASRKPARVPVSQFGTCFARRGVGEPVMVAHPSSAWRGGARFNVA